MNNVTLDIVRAAFTKKGYVWSDKFNLFGIRRANGKVNDFDDLLGYAAFFNGQWLFACYNATTEPGLDPLVSPQNRKGTAILKEGQYIDAYMIGLHQNKRDHRAFVQAKPLPVFRDSNKTASIELDPKSLDKGIFGINIHRANVNSLSTKVGPWSAGCQVFQRPLGLEHALKLAAATGQKFFTYTLLNENDL